MGKSHGEEIAIGFMIGIFFAIIIGLLYSNNIFVDKVIPASLTITEVQFVFIFVWLIIGIIIWAYKS